MSKTLKSTSIAALTAVTLGLSAAAAQADKGDRHHDAGWVGATAQAQSVATSDRGHVVRQSASTGISDATAQPRFWPYSFRYSDADSRDQYPSGREGR